MKTFVPQGDKMFFYPIMPLAATFYEHATPLGSIFTFPLPPRGIYFFYKTRNGSIFHPTAYDNQFFGTIHKNKIGTISDMHVSRCGRCGYHFSICI
jgi:hypothetical protein